jgi:protoporphyrin/coproporphyrin ferrochelatase
MTQRPAVVLLNLGGPDSLKAVRPFLYNLFSDPDIFAFPLGRITQRLFAFLISWRRREEAAKGYAAIGGKSPLLEHTQEQAIALQLALAGIADVFVCMRYWHPLTAQVVRELKQKGYSKVLLLPRYCCCRCIRNIRAPPPAAPITNSSASADACVMNRTLI